MRSIGEVITPPPPLSIPLGDAGNQLVTQSISPLPLVMRIAFLLPRLSKLKGEN